MSSTKFKNTGFSSDNSNISIITEINDGQLILRCTGTGTGRIILLESYRIKVSGTFVNTSDNRLKHNEKSFKSPLQGIRKLNPLQYFKTQTLYDENHHFELDTSGNPIDSSGNLVEHVIENGLIAQELLHHEEFKPFVFVSKEIDEETGQEQPMSVAYNSIFVYAIAALKELDAAHTQTKLELDETKQRLQALEERMAALENR